jgi:primosomal protein N' (replication factor Y)
MKNMKIVTVIPLQKGIWKENLTYFTAKDVPNGSIVVIPLRNKKVLGLVISIEDVATSKSNIKDMSFNLKKISEVKEISIFSKEYLDTAIETSKYFAASKNYGITALIPAPLRENYDKIAKLVNLDSKNKTIKQNSKLIKSEKLIFQAPFLDRIATYKTLIRGAFAEKKSVFIVLPTEYDIKIFEESLSRGIEQFIFTLHSGLTAKKIIRDFEEMEIMSHPILILGTAPFLSIPRDDIKIIIMEHESSNAYKMIVKPNFDLRFFAELFAAKINAKFILSDTMLRLETIERKDADNLIPFHPLQFRTNFKGKIEIIDKNTKKENLTQEKVSKNPVFKVFSEESLKEIKNAVFHNKSVFIFSLRKGLATMTVCKDCNDTLSCKKCGSPLVLYSSQKNKKRIFVCNRCETDVDGDVACENCGSWNLMPLGIGIDTIYEEMEEMFEQKVKIFKLDKESAKTTKGAEKIIKEFEESPGSILIGTEMAFFYLQKKVSLSIVASFDSLWSIPNFKMGEKIIHIILSIMSHTNEKIIIQTKNEYDTSIMAIKSGNFLSFAREELEDRKKLNYPPFKRFIKITYISNKEETIKARKTLEEVFKEYNPEIFSAFIARQKPARPHDSSGAGGEKYTTNALIRLDPKKWSLPEISHGSSINEQLLAKLISLPSSFQVLVDPEDLL